MFELAAVFAMLTCNAVDSRVLVNDVEVILRERCERLQEQVDLSPYLMPGENRIVLQARPAWGGGPPPRTPGRAPVLTLAARLPPRGITVTMEGSPNIELREPAKLPSGVYHDIGITKVTLRSDVPEPVWVAGQRLTLDDNSRETAHALANQLKATVEGADYETLRGIFDLRIRREARRLGMSVDDHATAFTNFLMTMASREGWRVQLLPPTQLEVRLQAEGRILRVRGPNNEPPLRAFVGDDLVASFDMEFTLVEGRWVLL